MSKFNFIQVQALGNNAKLNIRETTLFRSLFTSSNKKIFLLILINLSITVFLSVYLNIWLDEAYTLNTTSKDLFYAVHQSLYFEFQPPAYFVFLALWRDINTSIFFARLFSVICISFSIYLIPKLSNRYLPDIKPFWLALIFAINPFTVWAASEIRPYALIILLSILLLIFFYDAYLYGEKTKYSRWIYILLAVMAVYTQYYAAFLLIANAAVLLVNKKWSILRKYLLDMIIPVLSLSIIIPQILLQTRLNYDFNLPHENFFQGLRFIYQRCEEYLLPVSDYLKGEPKRWTFRIGLIILLYFTLKPIPKKIYQIMKGKKLYAWPIVISLFLIFSFLLTHIGHYFLLPRHTAVLFIPLLILFLSIISLNNSKKYLTIWAYLIILIYGIALTFQYKPLAKPGDFIRVADYIMGHESSNQPILIFRREMALPFKYYYSGINELVPIPEKFNFQSDYNDKKSDWALKSETEVANTISKIPDSPTSFWLLTNQDYKIYGNSVNSHYLENYVNQNFTTIDYIKFYGVNLRFIRKK